MNVPIEIQGKCHYDFHSLCARVLFFDFTINESSFPPRHYGIVNERDLSISTTISSESELEIPKTINRVRQM